MEWANRSVPTRQDWEQTRNPRAFQQDRASQQCPQSKARRWMPSNLHSHGGPGHAPSGNTSPRSTIRRQRTRHSQTHGSASRCDVALLRRRSCRRTSRHCSCSWLPRRQGSCGRAAPRSSDRRPRASGRRASSRRRQRRKRSARIVSHCNAPAPLCGVHRRGGSALLLRAPAPGCCCRSCWSSRGCRGGLGSRRRTRRRSYMRWHLRWHCCYYGRGRRWCAEAWRHRQHASSHESRRRT